MIWNPSWRQSSARRTGSWLSEGGKTPTSSDMAAPAPLTITRGNLLGMKPADAVRAESPRQPHGGHGRDDVPAMRRISRPGQGQGMYQVPEVRVQIRLQRMVKMDPAGFGIRDSARALGAREGCVARADEESRLHQRRQNRAAQRRIETPQPRSLRFRQLKSWHLQKLCLCSPERRRKRVGRPVTVNRNHRTGSCFHDRSPCASSVTRPRVNVITAR